MAGLGCILFGGDEGRAIASEVLGRYTPVVYRSTFLTDAPAANVVFANGKCLRRFVLQR